MGIESYLGVPLQSADGRRLGHPAVSDDRPVPAEPRRPNTQVPPPALGLPRARAAETLESVERAHMVAVLE